MSTFTLYRFWAGDTLLYVGQTTRGMERLAAHEDRPWHLYATAITLQRFESIEKLLTALLNVL